MSQQADFVPTGSILDEILAQKQMEIARKQEDAPYELVAQLARRVSPPRDFVGALRRETVALIAEVKKASPSKGTLTEHFDPVQIANLYADHGAAALSVLTDEPYFQGHLGYLLAIRDAVRLPILRKDFILSPYQVLESRMARADALLLIVAALSDEQLAELHALTISLGMAALVEVHNEDELQRALKVGATLIGINNRDLKTFEVDRETVARLARDVPEGVTLVAESGLRHADDVRDMGAMGAHAVLVGEALMVAEDVAAAVRAFASQPRSAQA